MLRGFVRVGREKVRRQKQFSGIDSDTITLVYYKYRVKTMNKYENYGYSHDSIASVMRMT